MNSGDRLLSNSAGGEYAAVATTVVHGQRSQAEVRDGRWEQAGQRRADYGIDAPRTRADGRCAWVNMVAHHGLSLSVGCWIISFHEWSREAAPRS